MIDAVIVFARTNLDVDYSPRNRSILVDLMPTEVAVAILFCNPSNESSREKRTQPSQLNPLTSTVYSITSVTNLPPRRDFVISTTIDVLLNGGPSLHG